MPIGPDRSPAVTETFLVGVAVLQDHGRDLLGVADGEPEACRRVVIKNINRKAVEADDFGEALDDVGDVVERVAEFIVRRHIGLTEAGKVRRDHKKSAGEQRDQITKHVARAREAVQQQQLRCVGWPRFTIEDLETVDIGRAISDRHHENPLRRGQEWLRKPTPSRSGRARAMTAPA